ncbi:MAG: hypothetical protein ACFCU5_01925 [Pleurocapsa sp.]
MNIRIGVEITSNLYSLLKHSAILKRSRFILELPLAFVQIVC